MTDRADARWFAPDHLVQLSRPTMDRAIEAIDAGDYDAARRLCNDMRYEWRFLHDVMVELTAGLITFVQRRLGEAAVPEAWAEAMERGWKRDTAQIIKSDRRKVVEALAASWRAHSTSGVGSNPGAFTIVEDDEKFIFRMNPCGSGQRLWRNGRYEGPNGLGLTREAHTWTYNRKNFPVYCTHCTFMNELLPLKWYGLPLYPSEPPEDFDTDPCTWYWYKDPADVPELYWRRYDISKANDLGARDR